MIEIQVAGRGGVPSDATAASLSVTAVHAATDGFATVYPCGPVPEASNVNFAAGGTVPNAVITSLANGKVCLYTSADADFLVDVSGSFTGDFVSMTPVRFLDTRPTTPLAAGSVTPIQVAGVRGVPGNAETVSVNLTIVDAPKAGYATVFPCGSAPPNTSNLNFVAGQTIPNAAVTGIGTAGTICLFTDVTGDFLIDVNGVFVPGSSFEPIVPSRLLDTRGQAPLAAGSVREVQVAGLAGVPTDASAAWLNVTMVDADAAGFATVFPCDGAPPNASNLNFVTGQTFASAVLTKIGSRGKVCIFTSTSGDFLMDISGYIRP